MGQGGCAEPAFLRVSGPAGTRVLGRLSLKPETRSPCAGSRSLFIG